jgi:hypothetical protein
MQNLNFTPSSNSRVRHTTCQAKECRFPDTHITMAHKCGTCGDYGHGQLECNNSHARQNLQNNYKNEKLPEVDHCNIDKCLYPWSHTRDAHHCGKCFERATHSINECSNNRVSRGFINNNVHNSIIKKKCPTCKQKSDVDLNFQIFTDDTCIICIEKNKKIIFSGCNHANVCKECCKKLD